ncbi:MAG: TonB-dependent receptor [Hyphomonadaceae bacterium]
MKTSTHASILVLTALLAAPASAREDEIVVTATRRPEAARNLPADVQVIDAAAARLRGDVSLDQAVSEAAGIQAPRAGPIGQQASIFSGGFESNHTLVLFDGVRMDDPSTPEGVFDAGQDTLGGADRIEIVQGPMSALYGSAALGGVINILPRHGREGALNPGLEVAAGSFGTVLANASGDGTSGRLRYAVNAEAYASSGYDIVPARMATYTGEPDGAEIATLTGLFDYALSDAFSIDLLVRRRQARADFDPGFFGNIGENPQAEIRQNDAGLFRVGATWRPSGGADVRISGGGLDTDRVTANAGVNGDEYHGERRFWDAAGAWQVNAWRLQLGAQTEQENITARSFGALVEGEQNHTGAFAAANGPAGPFNIAAAIRRDDFGAPGAATTWRAGASYDAGARARVYAAYGTSFRAPSLYELHAPFFGAADLTPERARSWEIGADARVSAFSRPDGAEASLLLRTSEIDDLIGFQGLSYANFDRAKIDFAEARVALRPLDWLTAHISYANTNARDAGAGQALQRRPRHAWAARIEADWGRAHAELGWRETGARLDTVYDDLGAFGGVAAVPSYELVRASASWALSGAARIFVTVDNLLDQSYEPVNGFAGAPVNALVGIRLTP